MLKAIAWYRGAGTRMGVPVIVYWPGSTEQQLDEQLALSSDHAWGNWMAEREGEPNSAFPADPYRPD